jgi:hypothetical protein
VCVLTKNDKINLKAFLIYFNINTNKIAKWKFSKIFTLERQLISCLDGAKIPSMKSGLGVVDCVFLVTHFDMHKKRFDFDLQATSAAKPKM